VRPIIRYLAALSYAPIPNCEPGHYYVLNNLEPGYKADGSPNTSAKAVPPSGVRSIGDALTEKGISFAFYGGGFNEAKAGKPNHYCGICNPFQYQTSTMADAKKRAEHLKDVQDLFTDITGETLPAVAYVKPDWWLDGHPESSKLSLFEAFARNIIERVEAKPELFKETAIFVTFDEGGGYYDSGFIQPLDFFGDGPRIPFIAVSPYAKGGRIVHTYGDHASVVKFIERNWGLAPLTGRSRDNLPNPVMSERNAYVPANMPAIGDLFDMFSFP
jgi:phospholipase C